MTLRLLATVAGMLCLASIASADAVPSYLNDVMPILTKSGCNQGSCHGKGSGQNGFKLSLRGYAPDDDHRQIVRDSDGRRLDAAEAELSLLLTKPLAAVPHEGGKIWSETSREYRTVLAWIRAGAPGPDAKEPKIASLSLSPNERVMKPGEAFDLHAEATFSDGSKRDVTWLTKFDSNDSAVATVDAKGHAEARRAGSTAIRAAFLTEVAVTGIAVPHEKPIDEAKFPKAVSKIDEHVFAKLKALRIEPSATSDDAEFHRRVFLDATGTLPTPDEVRTFLADKRSDKRARLIDDLLERPEFVDYWTLFLSDLLQNRKERDHDVRGTKGVRQFHAWIREQVLANRGWHEIARDVLTAKGDTATSPQLGYTIVTVGEQREVEKSEIAESVAQAFLGTRIGCARCHNHPLERTTQDDFYHFSAFFTRIKLDRKESKQGTTKLTVAHHDDGENKQPVRVRQPRTNAMLVPQTLDRAGAKLKPGDDPREALANWIANPANEAFSGAMVNRMWKHFLGVGLVEPVDDLRGTNPPSNADLWKELNRSFAASKYDLKGLIRSILNSATYQLASATTPNNATDGRFYSHYYARRLPAEVLLDAIGFATGIPETFDGYPEGLRAIQIPDPGAANAFLKMFGSSERVTACACERNGDVTLTQLLSLQNGDKLLAKLKDGRGTLAKLLKDHPDDAKLIDELYLRTLSRLPSTEEKSAISKLFAAGEPRGDVARDLFWALLNAKEFAFGH